MAKEKQLEAKKTNKRLYLDLNYAGILIFFLFRIPLTNIIGNEGNGYFSVTWELYTLFGLVFGHGLYHVTRDMIQKRNRKAEYHNSTKVLSLALIISFVLSVLGFIIIYSGSDKIFSILSMELSRICFRLLGILLIINAVSGVLRGYFEGCGTSIPTCFSKIIEAFIAGTGAVIFASAFYKYGTKVGALLFEEQYKPAFGSAGIAAGCVCGGIFSLFFLLIVNAVYQKPLKQLLQKKDSSIIESIGSLLKEFSVLSFITLIELLAFNLFRFVNMTLYIKTYSNTELKGKIVQYLGSYHGKVLILTGIMALIILSVTGKYIKRIQKCFYKNNLKLAWRYFCDDIKQVFIFSIPIAIILGVFAKNILSMIYKSAGNTEVMMLQIGSINILLIPLAVYLFKLIKQLDLKLFAIIIPIVSFIIQTIVMGTLVKLESVATLSLIIAEVTFWLLIVVFELFVIIKTIKLPTLEHKVV